MLDDSKTPPPGPARGRFPLTHWTLVFHAGRDSSPGAREAFGDIYQMYREPLLVYLLRKGNADTEAQDLLQGFFESLLERGGLSAVEKRGHFRTWLLTSLQNYCRDVWDRRRAQKRGGGREAASLEAMADAGAPGPAHPGLSPEEEYERQCAERFVEKVLERLAEEYRRKGKARQYAMLSPLLLEKRGEKSQAELGIELGMTEANVNQAVFRLRQRFQMVFREELAPLVGEESSIEEEFEFLLQALLR